MAGDVLTSPAITKGARTGKIGDGKVFVLDLESALRVRTGETGDEALRQIPGTSQVPGLRVIKLSQLRF